MKTQEDLGGVGTALVTPFYADGSLDLQSLRLLTEWQIASGISLLVACGSTGEAATLSEDETLQVVQTVVEAAAGRVPVFAGCTHNSTAEAVRRAKALAAVPGVGGILTANPYYSKPNQRGQFLHFKAVADAVAPVPVLLYNIPGRTAANLEPATVVELAGACPNIVGVKESSGSMPQITDLIARVPAGIRVFAGDDYLALPVLAAGGVGVISVVSNAAPTEVVRMARSAAEADWSTAHTLGRKLAPLTTALFREPNPCPVKSLLHSIGRIESDAVRLPLVPVTEALRDELQRLLQEVGA
ncbi:4-hydroxy-tetrahydrodipicolinate synthase [Terriglobus aquaticus]|uniref:4-hydroxy-tetrahydrodipicolinate synthase n=1 Tax=Terriglobus aquaticus TaxID=940139 RepID=A0ABW9KKM6_9BACT|nr:4-hydroxy-tetrahydrodipicolinate synthase [Terriglobus aquaticus]